MNKKTIFFFLFMLLVGVVGSANAIECKSDCCDYPDCEIKMDCKSLCTEQDNSIKCGWTVYKCSDNCTDESSIGGEL